MEITLPLTWLIILLIGIALGMCIERMNRDEPVGTLRVDHSDPEEAYLFLELDRGINDIYNKKYVALRVDIQDYISRK